MATENTKRPQANDLNERARQLLKVLVQRYISNGEPVGSRTLSRALATDAGLTLSPASVRNIMADLETMGLVSAPHTSAGRIPTVKGYRLFVDSLLSVKSLHSRQAKKLQLELAGKAQGSRALLASASDLLSSVTRLAGVVTLPNPAHAAWRHIEFLPLSENRALAILVVNDGDVQNRILQLDRRYPAAELQRAANYLNTHFSGQSLDKVRRSLLADMRSARQSMNAMMQNAIQMAEQALGSDESAEDFVLAGQTNLMDFAELSNVGKLRSLFDAFNEKRDLLHLLDRCVNAEGVRIFIGEESGYRALDDCSVVTAPYRANDETIGVLGVIGPTRMAYDRVIPIVDITAKLLSNALNSQH